MKHLKLFIVAFAALAGLSSCNQKITETIENEEGSMLRICFDAVATKAGTVATTSEKQINSLQVLIFGASGAYEKNAEVNVSQDKMSATANVMVVNGQKTVWAVANAPEITGSNYTATTIKTLVENLSDNSASSFIMSGSKEKNVTSDTSLEIELKRLVSKVCLTKVTRNFSDAGKAELDLVIEDAYLSNVPGQAYIFGSIPGTSVTNWYNKLGSHSDTALDGLLYKGNLNYNLSQGGNVSPTDVTFYTYANTSTSTTSGGTWSPRVSRLVLTSKLAGLSTPFYYVVNLPQFEPNKVYNIELVLTRPGSDDPDTPDGEGEVSISVTSNITVSDWDSASELSETF